MLDFFEYMRYAFCAESTNERKIMTLYGISGYARVGKDTFAELLAEELYKKTGKIPKRFSFANSLKGMLDPLFQENFGISTFTANDEEKKIVRPALVGLGESARKVSENFWVNKIAPKVQEALSQGYDCIVTDVRYKNEAIWIKSFENSKVIGLMRNGVSAPNNEEAQSIPLVFEVADQIIKWPEISQKDNFSVLSCEELRSVVKSSINY